MDDILQNILTKFQEKKNEFEILQNKTNPELANIVK